ncbi:hypothetical protein MMAG44476_06246 [Mycolicibacterium mageritense DSM 44476 = CIP 104973]|uniref:TQXA domain-containing protein n=1 Tax=Mycolicibacterium mageritense TaxID=53462 RepID=A0ABM7I5T5_MYCME|nr:thioester domain-containing protein [Mycolicibacterium mageritense]MCC9182727.1 thioester domain-containing protein [Mycolicibacterium mageritense]BBX38299.1 TQXA domain-containing protein [Mycolicibacterium mageritense]GJJ22649.1 TQXA domain-containing protein [Mycolicibacterium mageritense]CDO26967.1 TQXA domain protein [Mycolicibacterium mageritense DSM 44476 = CIP 104973]
MSVLSFPIVDAVSVQTRVRPQRTGSPAMTRYRGGTYSHTVDTVVFTDGSSARTDLIRLNPNVEAYSLDFTGLAPTRPSRYRTATFSAVPNLRARAYEAEVDWIVRNSFPTLGTAELSRRVRAAGYPLGVANVAEHEAIAATQAAIWFFTNGLALDNRPRNVPVAAWPHRDGVTFEFEGEPQLGGYTVELESDGVVSLTLQKSSDGVRWEDVAASGLNVGAGTHSRTLGVGSTVSSTRSGRNARGYRYYRLSVVNDRHTRVWVNDVRFRLNGSGVYPNPDRVVHLYNYLVAGAEIARLRTVEPALVAEGATAAAGLVGPLRLRATDRAAATVSDADIVDHAGTELDGPLAPGTEFYLRPRRGVSEVVLTVSIPADPEGFGGRAVTGVAHDESNSRLTPVVLAVPAPRVVEFDIAWADDSAARYA